ncbi:hypothetical protein HDU91_001550, partial [Kappamyces sp. JEL0680]
MASLPLDRSYESFTSDATTVYSPASAGPPTPELGYFASPHRARTGTGASAAYSDAGS